MKKKERCTCVKGMIARAPNEAPPKPPPFSVTAKQSVTLTFPNAIYGYGRGTLMYPFNKTLTADEARLLAASLNSAAEELTR